MNGCSIVFFDAGGTLLRPEPSVGEVYARVGRSHGVAVEPAAIEESFRREFEARRVDSLPRGEAWWRVVVERSFEPFGAPRDPGALFDELYAHFAEPAAWHVFPEVDETLDALDARGIRAGLVSNWDERLPGLLRGLGLLDRLDPVVVSAEVGIEKPSPGIFEEALRRAGVTRERAVMIGDEPRLDLGGARAAGLGAVLVDRRGRHPEVKPRVDRLTGLVELLDRGETCRLAGSPVP
jgi:putative hydrolase of the HAD superfamily